MNFKKEIEEIIKSFSIKNKVFLNEAQFQFDLAWAIKEKNEETNFAKGFDIFLEFQSGTLLDESGNNNFYTDILLKNEIGDFIPIELKYKTLNIKDDDIYNLKNQGAESLGKFDFLWDVQRIDLLKEEEIELDGIGKFIRCANLKNELFGLAIIISNDKSYWTSSTRQKQNSPFKKFQIAKGPINENIPLKGTIQSLGKKRVNKLLHFKDKPIESFEWKPYISIGKKLEKNNEVFKYMIVER